MLALLGVRLLVPRTATQPGWTTARCAAVRRRHRRRSHVYEIIEEPTGSSGPTLAGLLAGVY